MGPTPRIATAHLTTHAQPDFCSDVVMGLSQPGQKELPSKCLYDPVGSALFDVICLLPEYGLTRAGMRLLKQHSAEIVERVPSPVVVAELGSGSGQKTRWLLETLARAGGDLVPHLRLARAGWPAEPDPDLLWLQPHLARLRAKLDAANGPAIVAVRGVGYRVEPRHVRAAAHDTPAAASTRWWWPRLRSPSAAD